MKGRKGRKGEREEEREKNVILGLAVVEQQNFSTPNYFKILQ